jgi:hypothetical protein
MSKEEPKVRVLGPRRSLHGIIWLVGLIILAVKGWWWPGILVLVLISFIYEAYLRRSAPQAYVEQSPEENAPSTPPSEGSATVDNPAPVVASNPAPAAPLYPLELLPPVCPSCNGPIRGHEVKWTGPQSANCPYCGTNLPMSKA